MGFCRTALDVPQGAIPSVAYLAGEKAEGVDLGTVGYGTETENGVCAHAAAGKVCPITLRFQTEPAFLVQYRACAGQAFLSSPD